MNWKTKRFSQLMTITKGEAITKASETEGPYPVILGGQEPAYYINRYNHEGKAIVISRSGASAGYASFWNEPIFVTDGFLIEPLNNNHIEYIFYLLKYFGKALHDLQNGSAIPHVTPKTIYSLKAPIPPESVQNKIAETLSTYDNLIEVNNKRIKLLEQMAENLYKEWFVRFRFPGYETAEFENGIPKAWKICKFSSISNILSGGTPSTEHNEYYGGEIPFYTPKDSSESYYVFDTITKLTKSGLQHCNSQLYPKNTIMITARGTVGNLNLLAVPMAMNQSCYALNSDRIKSPYYLFFLIKREIMKLQKMASGGVFDTIIISTFNHIKVFIPTENLIESFHNHISPIMDETYSILSQNKNLIKQRDLLLPRLMSGKLEV